ncbi:MAG: purine-nucleoside/S-methyl-5-thioadenosine phosphorylase / adenosine deaminase [Clostridiales bacterium]|nr:purine-nucleoside/S-methyl-5-thioadenosine phosphorylase / adenosine deaminase [Clostridiales bacterium]
MIMENSEGFTYHEVDGIGFFTTPLFGQTNVAKACFSTRRGGISTGALASLNLGFNRGDDAAIVDENYQRLCDAIGIKPEQLFFGNQVHGDVIKRVYVDEQGKSFVNGGTARGVDSLITDQPNVALVTLYADCVPLYFLDLTHKAIGLSHAGWRGTVAGIGVKTLQAMEEAFDTRPEQCLAAVGPSIGPCCFEVDEPVARRFLELQDAYENIVIKRGDKYSVDLWRANMLQLMQAGVKESNIALAGLCTACHPHLFYSHRRDKGDTGRMAAMIMLT